MMRKLKLAILFLCSVCTAARAGMVQDHLGHNVEIPDNLYRVVSLHDWTLTVMAHELGVPLAGSVGRLAPDGNYYIRGANELFGLDFNHIALASVHGKLDLERIRSLKPDLILGNVGDVARLNENLSSIAPTLMFDPDQGRPPFDLYREFAGWLGRSERFETLHDSYRQKTRAIRKQLANNGLTNASYVVVILNSHDGTFSVYSDYGVLTTMFDDLGLQRLPISREIPNGNSNIILGAEMLDALDADFIITPYLKRRGESPDTFAQDLDRIAPGAKNFLRAFDRGHVIAFPRNRVYPTSFTGLNEALDTFAHILKEN